MLLEPGERSNDVDEQRRQLEETLSQENQMVFVAEQDDRLVGYLASDWVEKLQRTRHNAEIVDWYPARLYRTRHRDTTVHNNGTVGETTSSAPFRTWSHDTQHHRYRFIQKTGV